MRFSFFLAALVLTVSTGAPAQTAPAPKAQTPAPAAQSTPATQAAPAAQASPASSTPKPAAKQKAARAAPAAESSVFSRMGDYFRSQASAGNAAAPKAKVQPATPARPQAQAAAPASTQGQSATQIMAARAASSYSTSSNAIGFGLYRIVPKETVEFREKHSPGTIIVRQREKRLYYVLGDGKALRYAIAVGREGAAWSGTSTVSNKREWPDWTPTPTILAHQPDLPRHVEGGPGNPLGARALYLGGTMYRIHGTNEPWRIGEEASSGCIRLTNDDIIDLYDRTRLGATVIVQR